MWLFLTFLDRQADARAYDGFQIRIGGDGLHLLGVCHAKIDIVADDEPRGPDQGQELVEIVNIAGLVRIEKDNINRAFTRATLLWASPSISVMTSLI